MKRLFTFVSLAALFLSTAAPSFAQRKRVSRKADPDILTTVTKWTKEIEKKRETLSTVQKETFATFGKAEAVTDGGGGAFIRWHMESEKGNSGFYVYRVDQKAEALVSEVIVAGSFGTIGMEQLYGEGYELFDPQGGIGSKYIIEALSSRGERARSEVVAAEYSVDLKTVAGRSGNDLRGFDPTYGSIEKTTPDSSTERNEQRATLTETTDLANHRLVVAQPGAKIAVKTEGMYRVRLSELQAASSVFTASNTANWRLYRQGIEQAIIVGSDVTGPYLEFYGKGIDIPESDTRVYYAIVGASPGKRMYQRLYKATTSTAISTSYATVTEKKERNTLIPDIINGDAENWWGRIVTSTPTTITASLTGIDFSQPNCTITLNMQGYSTSTPPIVSLSINGHAIGNVSSDFIRVPFSGQFTIPTSFLVEGTNSIQLTSMNTAADQSLFESFKISYARSYLSTQNNLFFPSPSNKGADLTGFSSANVRIFDLRSPDNVARITNVPVQQSGATFTAKWHPRARMASGSMVAVADTGLLTAASVTTNTPSTLSSTVRNADLVIISYSAADFMASAGSWGTYRANQGFNVAVVDVADVYDEFGWGSATSASIYEFLFYVRGNWTPQVPDRQYVLLLGDASFNPRNYSNLSGGFFNYVPTKIVPTIYNEVSSDEALADFDADGLAEMAIGRVPARDTTYINNVLAKTQAFEASAALQDVNRGAVLAFDRPDGYDFLSMSQELANQLPGSVPKTYVGRAKLPPYLPGEGPFTIDPNGHANLVWAVNAGPYIVNYAGHGAQGTWGHQDFLGNVNAMDFNNMPNQALFTMLTCLNGRFIGVSSAETAIAETLVKTSTMGGPASWASTGLTTADVQLLMGKRFYNQIGIGNIKRMGDLIRDAKQVIPAGADVRFSWVLLGDPMLKVRP